MKIDSALDITPDSTVLYFSSSFITSVFSVSLLSGRMLYADRWSCALSLFNIVPSGSSLVYMLDYTRLSVDGSIGNTA